MLKRGIICTIRGLNWVILRDSLLWIHGCRPIQIDFSGNISRRPGIELTINCLSLDKSGTRSSHNIGFCKGRGSRKAVIDSKLSEYKHQFQKHPYRFDGTCTRTRNYSFLLRQKEKTLGILYPKWYDSNHNIDNICGFNSDPCPRCLMGIPKSLINLVSISR